MELVLFILLVILMGLAAPRWGGDSRPGMGDTYRRQCL